MANTNKVVSLQTPTEIIINVEEICRFCLSHTKSGVTINNKCPGEEFEQSEQDSIYNFVTKLNFVKMENNTNFPLRVCENCHNLVKICNGFSQLCQKSDALLREFYEKSLTELENPIQDEIKIFIKFPNTQDPEINLDYNDAMLANKKTNDIQKAGLNILEVYKQKLNLLIMKLEDAHLRVNSGLGVKKEQLTCHQCLLNFSSVRAFNFHNVAMHDNKRLRTLFKFQGKNCLKLFTDEAKLKRHYKITHKVSPSELPNEYSYNSVKGSESCELKPEEKIIKHLEAPNLDDLQLYACPFCNDLKFPTRVSFNEHVLSAHNVKDEDFNDSKQSNMLVHTKPNADLSDFINIVDSVVNSLTVAQEEKDLKLICKNCNPLIEFSFVGDFVKHITTHHVLENCVSGRENQTWSCGECSASYTKKQSLYCHMREKHRRNGMKCLEPGCSECFNTNRKLIQHGIVAHQKYFADFHKVFTKALQSTDEVDNKVKNFECDICQKRYIYKTSLRKHIFGSHLDKQVKDPVVCSYCGKALSSKLNLKSHIEFVHEAIFVSCPICKKKINFRTIGKHYKTHKTNPVISKNSFLCNLCGKILKSKRSFDDHQKLHKNIRDELCDVCGSGFTTKKFLRLHKKTHEGAPRKVFGCHQCEKAFSGRQTLNRHLLTHSGEKNFICEICSKCFYTLQELNRHVRCHKKEYRFDCQLCDMRFLDKSRFRHHMMRHRNVRPHKCQFCEKMFIVRGKMHLHMAAKHNVEVESRKGVWKDPKTYVPLDVLL